MLPSLVRFEVQRPVAVHEDLCPSWRVIRRRFTITLSLILVGTGLLLVLLNRQGSHGVNSAEGSVLDQAIAAWKPGSHEYDWFVGLTPGIELVWHAPIRLGDSNSTNSEANLVTQLSLRLPQIESTDNVEFSSTLEHASPSATFSKTASVELRLIDQGGSKVKVGDLPLFQYGNYVREKDQKTARMLDTETCQETYHGISVNGLCFVFSKLASLCFQVEPDEQGQPRLTVDKGYYSCEWDDNGRTSVGTFEDLPVLPNATRASPLSGPESFATLSVTMRSSADPRIVEQDLYREQLASGTSTSEAYAEKSALRAVGFAILSLGIIIGLHPLLLYAFFGYHAFQERDEHRGVRFSRLDSI